MKLGWFAGKFEPTAYRLDVGETAVKYMKAGRIIKSYYHPHAIVFLVVLSGEVVCNKGRLEKGDVFVIHSGENAFLHAIEDSSLLYCIWGDTEYSRNLFNEDYYEYRSNKFNIRPSFRWNEGFECISVVVHGDYDEKYTPVCLSHIRKILPGSEIILSTWSGSDVKGDYDVLALSDIPDQSYCSGALKGSINRHIITLNNGLIKATRKYVLIISPKTVLLSNVFLDSFDRYPLFDNEYRIVNHKILISSLFIKHDWFNQDDEKYYPYLFDMSDLFFFGYREDIEKLFLDIPLVQSDELFTRYRKAYNNDIVSFVSSKEVYKEQYIAVEGLKKYGIIDQTSNFVCNDLVMTKEAVIKSEKYIMNNYILLDFGEHGIFSPDYELALFDMDKLPNYNPKEYYTSDIYKKMYDYFFLNNGSYDDIWDTDHYECTWWDSSFEGTKNRITKFLEGLDKRNVDIVQETTTVDSEDISVVIQGAIDNIATTNAIKSVREFLPKAQLIVSTWENSNCDSIDYDEIVFNKDPGAAPNGLIDGERIGINNVNRQIVSTQGGIEKARRKYTLKLRSDSMLLDSSILNYLGELKNSSGDIFEKKIIVGDLYCREYFKYLYEKKYYAVPTPFHVSDWFYFGLTSDLKKIFKESRLMSIEEQGNYKFKNAKRKEESHYYFKWRFPPEQYIIYDYLTRINYDFSFDDLFDWNEMNIDQSKKFFEDNFIILCFLQHKILNMKYEKAILDNNGVNYTESGLIKPTIFRSK